MRKWFWCCTAASVMAAGVIGTFKYCGSHPDSSFTKVVASACEMGLRTTPFSGLQSAPLGAEDGLPTDQLPCRDGEAKPVVQVDLPGNVLEMPKVLVIRGDDELKDPSLVVQERDDNDDIGDNAVVEWRAQPTETVAPHKIMPYSDEDMVALLPPHTAPELCAFMPYADEDACVAGNHEDGFFACLWAQLAQSLTSETVTTQKVEGATEESESGTDSDLSLWRRFIRAIRCEEPGAAGGTEESEPQEDSHEQPYYHDHSQTCPYSGRSYSCPEPYSPRLVPVEQPKVEPMKGGSEESEAVPPIKNDTSYKPIHSFDDPRELLQSRPAFPRIDTMEFRPSDHKLNEYGQGPGTL